MAAQYWFFRLYDQAFSFITGVEESIWHYRNTLKALIVSIVTITLICSAVELMKKAGKKLPFVDKVCCLFGIR